MAGSNIFANIFWDETYSKDEVDALLAAQDAASEITYSNTTSGMTATDVQAAIDEVEGRVDSLEGSAAVARVVVAGLSGNQTINATTWTKLSLVESVDTDGEFESNRHTPQTAGYWKYELSAKISSTTTAGPRRCALYLNGAAVREAQNDPISAGYTVVTTLASTVQLMNGTTDYMEGFAYTADSSSGTVYSGISTYFHAYYIGQPGT